MNINLHIERLVLDGISLDAGQRPLLQAAVEAELARLLSSGGLAPALQTGGARQRLTAPSMQLTGGGSPDTFGRQIARSVYGGIGR